MIRTYPLISILSKISTKPGLKNFTLVAHVPTHVSCTPISFKPYKDLYKPPMMTLFSQDEKHQTLASRMWFWLVCALFASLHTDFFLYMSHHVVFTARQRSFGKVIGNVFTSMCLFTGEWVCLVPGPFWGWVGILGPRSLTGGVGVPGPRSLPWGGYVQGEGVGIPEGVGWFTRSGGVVFIPSPHPPGMGPEIPAISTDT